MVKIKIGKNSLICFVVVFLVAGFIAQLFISSVIFQHVAYTQTLDYLNKMSQRVKDDIVYADGKWDLSRYNADPQVPDTYPLYILSADGFVLDRWKPLHGFLDTADFNKLLTYNLPATVTTPSDQMWRMLSIPLTDKGNIIGTLTVGYFNPSNNVSDIDNKLYNDVKIIQAKILISGGRIDVQHVDPRDVSYDVSYEVVDKFNQILTKNNNTNSIDRIPNYIDRSYVGDILNSSGIREIIDSTTNSKFLLVTSSLNNKGNVQGVIVIGKSIDFISSINKGFLLIEGIVGISTIPLLTFLILFLIKKLGYFSNDAIKNKVQLTVITFDQEKSLVYVNGHKIQIPYATNQYYLCKLLFNDPHKKWEADEILEGFGEDFGSGNWRKIYDAMLSVNKKLFPFLDEKLIITHDKIYQINPEILKYLEK